jgi:hypothetical protein
MRQGEAQGRDPGAAEERRLEALVEGVRQLGASPAGAREEVVGSQVGDGRQHRESERAADLLRGVDQPARETRLLLADT